MQIEVKQVGEKEHGLFVDGQLIGTSKTDCDARFHMHFLERKVYEATRAAVDAYKAERIRV